MHPFCFNSFLFRLWISTLSWTDNISSGLKVLFCVMTGTSVVSEEILITNDLNVEALSGLSPHDAQQEL